MELNPLGSDTRYALAVAYQEAGRTTQAIGHYEQLVAVAPKHHKAGDAKRRLKKLRNPQRVH